MTDSTNEMQAAQERLVKAAQVQMLQGNPAQIAMSAYLNGILQSCRVDALVKLHVEPPNESWTPLEALNAAYLRAMTEKAEMLEKANTQIQVAQSTPKLHLVS
jgi:hypothetical protein